MGAALEELTVKGSLTTSRCNSSVVCRCEQSPHLTWSFETESLFSPPLPSAVNKSTTYSRQFLLTSFLTGGQTEPM